MPQGDAKDLPKPIEWPKGWVHGKPDLVLHDARGVRGAGDRRAAVQELDHRHRSSPRTSGCTIAEARPGAPGVVHHVVAYILKAGQTQPVSRRTARSRSWSAGRRATWAWCCPPDTALRLPKGCELRLEMHYTPNGTKVEGPLVGRHHVRQEAAEVRAVHERVRQHGASTSPPHDPHYKAEATFRLPADARLISLTPHMHWRGKHYFYEVDLPRRQEARRCCRCRAGTSTGRTSTGSRSRSSCPKGTKLHAVAHWDNSTNNPLNPDPTKPVRFGLQTWEEMMVGFVAYVWERPETAAELAKNPPKPADQFFDRLRRATATTWSPPTRSPSGCGRCWRSAG